MTEQAPVPRAVWGPYPVVIRGRQRFQVITELYDGTRRTRSRGTEDEARELRRRVEQDITAAREQTAAGRTFEEYTGKLEWCSRLLTCLALEVYRTPRDKDLRLTLAVAARAANAVKLLHDLVEVEARLAGVECNISQIQAARSLRAGTSAPAQCNFGK